ncbi:MAG: biotin--[acetyl-CoA-carboxylase] ligase [Chloroflexi bacterium]|nr:biotin--[acetyl-CoA-carboxylase] ligase [Chloroflexota bacterium]
MDLAALFPGRRALFFPTVGSTNDLARELASRGAPEGTLVVADEQTAGRGRLGRRWLAPAGTSILLSVLYRPAWTTSEAFRLTMACSLGTAEAVKAITGLEARIKWPNDILVNGKKVGGILAELGWEGERLSYAVVGLGLNVNWDVTTCPEIARTATSLSIEAKKPIDRQGLLKAIVEAVDRCYALCLSGKSEELRGDWERHLDTLNKIVTIETEAGRVQGQALGVDAEGALLVRDGQGQAQRITVGDVVVSSGL